MQLRWKSSRLLTGRFRVRSPVCAVRTVPRGVGTDCKSVCGWFDSITVLYTGVAKWYGNRLLTGISQVQILSPVLWSHSQAAKTPALQAGNEGSIPSGIIWRLSRTVMAAPPQGADDGFDSLRRQ